MTAHVIEFQTGKGLPKEAFEQIAPMVSEGRLVVFPTEISYVVGGDAFNQQTVSRVRAFQHDAQGPLALYISSITEFRLYVAPVVPRLRRALERCLPGPYGVIVRATQAAPRACVSSAGTIEVHMPASQSYQMFYEASGRPLVGVKLDTTRREDVLERFGEQADLIVLTNEPMSPQHYALIDFTQDPPQALQGELPRWL
ncbi:Threonylcarbamoyl-AMP synthase [bacterium HR07]|uniref:L-threonylcarbamoyladenylate synthase n=1 Tax=Acetithermum autotrophicum TaxID=1446466 RepID=H5SRH9_ACEAU|nr:translation factor [Candidatus Acetothermum autotrophicum]GBC76528.1 Threonylcarbamoyl-AMP synthase [bacterium HR07]